MWTGRLLSKRPAAPVIALVISAAGACRPRETTTQPAASSSADRSLATRAAVSAPAPRRAIRVVSAAPLEPLRGNWLEPLPLPDGAFAYVAPPLGAREPRPLLVAVHGAGDRPEWACGGWRLAASEYAFVVCPRGSPTDGERFAWDKPETIASAVERALAGTRARYGEYVANGPVLYLGFSQGATLAERALLGESRFSRVALAEGGYGLVQSAPFLARLRANGTERVMCVCGSPACFAAAQRAELALGRAGIAAQVKGDARAGHNLNQRMQVALQAAWPRFVDGLPNWSGFADYLARRKR